ncbi:short-chain dehydrogenase, partial [Streptomyces sp. SID13726]|nr:short-chain dehydrogenase [Streptomyces sp. SID13726]
EATAARLRAQGHTVLGADLASAGVHLFDPLTVQVNHFGAVATPEGLRPLLAAGTDPRALVVSSLTAVHPHDPAIADAALAAPEQIAPLLDFLTSPENTHVTGQIVFIDGGADATLRGEGAW